MDQLNSKYGKIRGKLTGMLSNTSSQLSAKTLYFGCLGLWCKQKQNKNFQIRQKDAKTKLIAKLVEFDWLYCISMNISPPLHF